MQEQVQAESNLHAVSLQLTHYLNDWIMENSGKGLNKIKSNINADQTYHKHDLKALQRDHEKILLKQKEKDKEKQKAEVCRIQFPIIQSRSKSSKDLMLPFIRSRNLNYQQGRSKLIKVRSQHKITLTPNPPSFNSMLIKPSNVEKHQKEIMQRLKRKRKRSPILKQSERNLNREIEDMDISNLKAMLIKQLKNTRASANKDRNSRYIYRKQQMMPVRQFIRESHK